ncbi:3-dehydroquinate synthase [Aliiglaciecola sp. LCG003]|uniref:3-dehydroquinate synthase n=1 Tax=Aliiglaciecola sp. LCG003 TaxID=3053655 RepID=UPI002572D803|nr:3-dehydroquinate synthase [Aliiglaciecola sp. LCG003]WJG10010.1 3-dehydroquinate synthase [Aliiglaciecola sp. LCG003]
MSTITVKLGERSYPINVDSGILSSSQSFASSISSNKVVVVTNDVVKPLLLDKLLLALLDYEVDVVCIPDGEQHKNLQQFDYVITKLLELKSSRDTTLLALGGGVVGDLTGFVAASYQRGMPFIQVPTTLLSQVDSSVGGKTAVNHPLGKNMIGAFYQPKSVVIDIESLSTLPAREFAAGMAEVIKYGIIYDYQFFSWLEKHADLLNNLSEEHLKYTITRCCEIKAQIVAEDETEKGIRAILNLGHTFGHAIEAEQGYGKWLHGEAVAVGMIIASKVAVHKGWLSESDLIRVEALIAKFKLPISPPANMDYSHFAKHMQHDKKVKSGSIRFVIPNRLGEASVTSDIDVSLLKEILG